MEPMKLRRMLLWQLWQIREAWSQMPVEWWDLLEPWFSEAGVP